MNTKHLLDKILDKWPAKVICLVIAIFLYFFHQASLIDSKTVVVPLQIIENGIVMHTNTDSGLVYNAILKSPESRSFVARTPPQPGQGTPVIL